MKKRMPKTNNATINQTAATETATTNNTNIQEEKEMKEKTTLWATIKNGIKRAIKFVVDVLLFVPRVIFYGVSHMVASLCLKASAAEDYDTDEYEFVDEEYPEVVIEEENEEVSADAETSLTKKELRKQAREERKEARREAREERKEAREARKEEKREAKAAAKEEKAAKAEAAVVEEVKAEATAEVIEEAKAEDTQVAEEAKAEATTVTEAVVAAGENNQEKVAIVPEAVNGEVVETTPAEVVETNQNASNNDSDASNVTTTEEHKHNHPVSHEHICEFRKDDIGWKEVSSFMSMVNLANDGNTLRAPSFVHPDRYMRYMRDITRPLLEAWCDRLGIEYQTMVGDENNRYMFAVAALEKCGEIDSTEADELKARACNWYAGMYPIAYQSMEVIQGVIAKYFKRFYGTWVMYTEDFTKAMTSAQEYFSKNNVVPRLSQDEANKYFPIDESLKGLNMEAPYVLGAMQH